jgi:hypothetical protein
VWTDVEKKAIFARMEEYFHMQPQMSRKDALRTAQTVLDPSRRIVVTDQRVFNYKDRIEIARANARKKNAGKALEAPAAIQAPPTESERKETPTEREGSTLERLAQAFERMLDIMADAVADRVADKVAERMAGMPAPQFQPGMSVTGHRPRHNPLPVSQPRQLRPGVLILGLLPQTGEQLRREFGTRLDIQWYDSDDASKRNVHPMANVVLMTKFINHSIQERWRKAGVLHYCNGGQGELRQILASL